MEEEKLTPFQEMLQRYAKKVLDTAQKHSISSVCAITRNDDVYGLSVRLYGLPPRDILSREEGYLRGGVSNKCPDNFTAPLQCTVERLKASVIDVTPGKKPRIMGEDSMYDEGMVTAANELPHLLADIQAVLKEYVDEYRKHVQNPPAKDEHVLKAFKA